MENVVIGLLLFLPGIYLLWFASYGHGGFYHDKKWEKWSPVNYRARVVGFLFSALYRQGGAKLVRAGFVVFALICIAVGIWAMCAF